MQHSCFENIYRSISAFQIISVIVVIVIFAIDDVHNEFGRNGRIDGEESYSLSLLVTIFIRPWANVESSLVLKKMAWNDKKVRMRKLYKNYTVHLLPYTVEHIVDYKKIIINFKSNNDKLKGMNKSVIFYVLCDFQREDPGDPTIGVLFEGSSIVLVRPFCHTQAVS